ncbi:hypothetical protein PGIN_ATCC49417_01140 [Porphyromonas gingivalis]|nr:hypothetical protein PGIN_ATCC49417_01140 [Porphyromonas gingivalis]
MEHLYTNTSLSEYAKINVIREFDIKEWHNTLVISVFYFPHSVFQTLILLSDGFLSTSEAQ